MKVKIIIATAAIALSACGGGGSSTPAGEDTTPVATEQPTSNPTDNQGDQVLTGRLVDSAVIGMAYQTATQSGITGVDGSFSYLAGESVVFSLGDIVLPSVEGASVVTPLDVFGTSSIGDTRVMNLTRLLQSLDVDGNADNGITLSGQAAASATGLAVNFSSPDFDNQVLNLVANSGSVTTSLIDGESALDHFQETLFQEGIQERPAAPDSNGNVPDPTNTASHPLVGTSASFLNFTHDIGGTLTVIDDRTLQVTNFTYDGGGPAVYFYLGTVRPTADPGAPLSSDFLVGQQIGGLLNGRVYNGDTITLTLPTGVTLDDFSSVSVWCDLFSINFGDARL